MRNAMLFAATLALTLTGCAHPTPSSVPVEPAPIASPVPPAWLGFCAHAKPITWSAKDTDGTLEQVKEHNALGVAHCDWGKKKDSQ